MGSCTSRALCASTHLPVSTRNEEYLQVQENIKKLDEDTINLGGASYEFSIILFGVIPFYKCKTTFRNHKYQSHGCSLYLTHPECIAMIDHSKPKTILYQSSITRMNRDGMDYYRVTFNNYDVINIYHDKIEFEYNSFDCSPNPYRIGIIKSKDLTRVRIDTIQNTFLASETDRTLLREFLTYPVAFSNPSFVQNNRIDNDKIFLLKKKGHNCFYLVTPFSFITRRQNGTLKIVNLDYIYYLSEAQIIYRTGTSIYDHVFDQVPVTYDFPTPTFETISVLTKNGTFVMLKSLFSSFNSEYLESEMKGGLIRLPGISKDEIGITDFFLQYVGSKRVDLEKYNRWIHERIWSLEIEE